MAAGDESDVLVEGGEALEEHLPLGGGGGELHDEGLEDSAEQVVVSAAAGGRLAVRVVGIASIGLLRLHLEVPIEVVRDDGRLATPADLMEGGRKEGR